MTLNELINALPFHPIKAQYVAQYVYRFMWILVHSGFFAQQNFGQNDQERSYVATNASKLLLKDITLTVRSFLQAVLDPILTTPCQHVTTWFQNDDLRCLTRHMGWHFESILGTSQRSTISCAVSNGRS
ncbi:hypothetical protein CISIN_1g045905mg [Citrus sinensis]|uniref:Plant methyltransferase dimerisation domain-containing protein n=1 Tax=Citrus sinensis TaxID=2711 RepID=A0A067DL40_CITSI|nr:hypothetical protein CISIN_1g045905mg [Citrus sinensis]